MLKIWGRRSAFNVQKVMWFIGELGLDHDHINAGGDAGRLDSPAFRAMNPHGRIPVIDDDGLMIWESNSIIRYLGAEYGNGRLWDPDPAALSLADRWLDWGLATAQRDFLDLFWGYYRTPEDRRDPSFVAGCFKRCARNYELLDQHLASRPYLAGDAFSIANIPAGTTLYRYFAMDIDRPNVPHAEAWYARLRERPAYQ